MTRHYIQLRYYIATALAVILLSTEGCSFRETEHRLNLVESLLKENPAYALRTIDSIDAKTLIFKDHKARYSLIRAIALDKNIIDTTDINIIMPAVNYFRRHGSPDEKLKAYLYLGRIYYNASDYDEAMVAYMIASENSDKASDPHYTGLLFSSMSEVFYRNYNFICARKYAEKAIEYFNIANDSVNVWYLTGRLASLYSEALEEQKADSLYRRFLEMPVADSAYYYSVALDYACELVLAEWDDPDETIRIFEKADTFLSGRFNAHDLCVYAYALELAGEKKRADELLSISESSPDNEMIDVWQYRIEKHRGNYGEALSFLEHTSDRQQKTVLQALERSVESVQMEYYQSKVQLLAEQEKGLAIQRVILICLIIITLLVSYIVYIHKKKTLSDRIIFLSNLKDETDRQLSLLKETSSVQYEQLSEKTNDLQSSYFALKKKYTELHRINLEHINELCKLYLHPSPRTRKNLLYSEVQEQLSFLKNDNDGQRRFEKMIDDSFDNAMDKFRTDFHTWSEKDIRFVAYVMAGFESKIISYITGTTPGSVDVKKNRVREKIRKSDSMNKNLFLEIMRNSHRKNAEKTPDYPDNSKPASPPDSQ